MRDIEAMLLPAEVNEAAIPRPKATSVTGCDIVVVIPVFKQPGFLAEALDSVLKQQTDLALRIVIVNDGCPFEETRTIAEAYATALSGKVSALYQNNRGLSAARNTGIDFALQAHPDFRALYLLDADNRIGPYTIDRMWTVLDGCTADVGWAYPNIDMFGFNHHYGVSGDYSVLCHILENYCEAGSLIHRTVIDAGVRFDENMKHGFEDWDFWLQAAGQGFRGRHAPDAGFRYRRRPESMLIGSERMRETIIAYLRAKHATLLKPRSLLKLEEAEACRYICFHPGGHEVTRFVDPRHPIAFARGAREVEELFASSSRRPRAVYFPVVCLFASAEAMASLRAARLDRNILWLSQVLLRDAHFVVLSLVFGRAGRLGIEIGDGSVTTEEVDASQMIVGRSSIVQEAAQDSSDQWIRSFASDSVGPRVKHLKVFMPAPCAFADKGAAFSAMALLLDWVTIFRLRMLTSAVMGSEWREDARKPRSRIPDVYSTNTNCGIVLPHVQRGPRRQVGFILPLFEFGGVEKVVLNYARVFRDLGFEVHLFIIERRYIDSTPDILSLFDSINFLADHDAAECDWDHLFLGAGLSRHALSGDVGEALGLLSTMDIVLNTHALAAHGVMASLRKQGVRTYVGLHLVEVSSYGQPMGNPNAALGYEHAYDGFIVISKRLETWCLSRGIPHDKIFYVPNAASYECDDDRLQLTLARRRSRPQGATLNLLYLGRLDAQKGLSRLREIIGGTTAPAFQWRVVGRAVMRSADVAQPGLGIIVEPPVKTDAELDALYEWADILVLPSRYEGVPLTVLEAQRSGCVPIVTDVGAVSEIVAQGANGFLVDASGTEQGIADEFLSLIHQLAADRALLKHVSRQCSEAAADNSWRSNMQRWLEDTNLREH